MLLSASTVFVLGGLILAFLRFHITIDVPEPRGAGVDVRVRCSSPVTGAWNRDQKGQLALWAVTRDSGELGYEVRSGEAPYCAASARRRLFASVVVLIAGIVLGVLALRSWAIPDK